MVDDPLGPRIHETNKAAIFVKVGGIINEMAESPVIEVLFGRSLKPVILDLLELEWTVAGESGKLSNRVAFFDPKLKPTLFIAFFDMSLLVDKSLVAVVAAKALFVLFRFSIKLNR